MSTYETIIKILNKNNISFKEFHHEPVRTSAEAAKVRPDIALSQGAKALIVKFKDKESQDYNFAMLVVPGDKRFDSKKVKSILNSKDVSFASEEEVIKITNGVVPGGVPPFGNIFDLRTIVDESLFENKEIAFNAGDKTISIVMSISDWSRVVMPEIKRIC
jgi:Ala-tRNA(Pro) deacylase